MSSKTKPWVVRVVRMVLISVGIGSLTVSASAVTVDVARKCSTLARPIHQGSANFEV
jgi:hypothetical protein